tara:strand:+ start:1429 stop:1620 length:192 start_codon:yes stop_codon:yes gene_type:complete
MNMKERIYEKGIEQYPEVFRMSELLELHIDDLRALDDALWADWNRVRKAVKAVEELNGEEEDE